MIWDTNEHLWELRYGQLVDWMAENDNSACVPIASGALGSWVAKQRQSRAKGRLAPARVARLDAIGFVWDTPANDWNERFQELVAWKAATGHTRVPFNVGALGWWVNSQRQASRKGKLRPSRVDRLNAIGFACRGGGYVAAASDAPPPQQPPWAAQPAAPAGSSSYYGSPRDPPLSRQRLGGGGAAAASAGGGDARGTV
ncbi:hypothetical protein I4F81_002322 [Pyropia yezoensis]|uniref:Uncharacterized protein n=1 Tax=Pyropia yezoensis TaxID=2788 RepID=A0ACC3BQ64_PYRYE|nr:hypothetical protein I4F81_002322 [Neopyropia yezoensis]